MQILLLGLLIIFIDRVGGGSHKIGHLLLMGWVERCLKIGYILWMSEMYDPLLDGSWKAWIKPPFRGNRCIFKDNFNNNLFISLGKSTTSIVKKAKKSQGKRHWCECIQRKLNFLGKFYMDIKSCTCVHGVLKIKVLQIAVLDYFLLSTFMSTLFTFLSTWSNFKKLNGYVL